MAEGHSPLEQFLVKRLVDICIGGDWVPNAKTGVTECTGLDASFTNSALFMLIAIALIGVLGLLTDMAFRLLKRWVAPWAN